MTTPRLAAALIALVLVATAACGGDDYDSVESGAEVPLTSVDGGADGDEDVPCDELRALAEARPPTGNLEAEEFEAAYHRYADAAEQAAEASAGADRQLLADFAELMRTIGTDPAADVADEVERLANPMQELASRASDECDVSLGFLPG